MDRFSDPTLENTVCRTCLKMQRKLYNIFKHVVNKKSVMNMLVECTAIQVEIDDGLPENICCACVTKLTAACTFKTMAKECDIKLRDMAKKTKENKTSRTETEKVKDDISSNKIFESADFTGSKFVERLNVADSKTKVESNSIFPEIALKRKGNIDKKQENMKIKQDNPPVDQLFGKNEESAPVPSPAGSCKLESDLDDNLGENEVEEDEESPQTNTPATPRFEKRKGGLSKKEQDQKTLLCKYCNKLFSFRYYFDIHVHQHTGNMPYKCELCDKRFVKRSMLNKHKQIHSDTKPFQCNVCGKRFKYLSNVHNHMVIHSEQKPYKCEICSKGFKVPGALKIHVRRHTGERPYICEICGKSFISQGDLALHIGTHNATKNFTCPKCGKSFANKMSLKVHLKRHSNYKPYSCDRCTKSFSTNAILQHHILIHTGEKPYACTVCGKAFRQSACLPRHMRIHTGETPYPCEQCPSKFKYKHHLLNHMKTHT
ncbi:zinc-finger associated domain containing protein [Oryctes borbonicus]|uniref:Zinc-finger associated domain containing protein n=1 Tax=Oryctes borbonicus TaxID=1629725 RepID=A0A0T6AVS8_9SCAR|nr:zinc-finger associated domain containing protein [Oryctes borbonicus]